MRNSNKHLKRLTYCSGSMSQQYNTHVVEEFGYIPGFDNDPILTSRNTIRFDFDKTLGYQKGKNIGQVFSKIQEIDDLNGYKNVICNIFYTIGNENKPFKKKYYIKLSKRPYTTKLLLIREEFIYYYSKPKTITKKLIDRSDRARLYYPRDTDRPLRKFIFSTTGEVSIRDYEYKLEGFNDIVVDLNPCNKTKEYNPMLITSKTHIQYFLDADIDGTVETVNQYEKDYNSTVKTYHYRNYYNDVDKSKTDRCYLLDKIMISNGIGCEETIYNKFMYIELNNEPVLYSCTSNTINKHTIVKNEEFVPECGYYFDDAKTINTDSKKTIYEYCPITNRLVSIKHYVFESGNNVGYKLDFTTKYEYSPLQSINRHVKETSSFYDKNGTEKVNMRQVTHYVLDDDEDVLFEYHEHIKHSKIKTLGIIYEYE